MNFEFDAVMALALFTLGAGLVIGIISFTRAKKAKDHHEDAAVADRQRHEDPVAPVEGTPGHIDPTASGHRGGPVVSGNPDRMPAEPATRPMGDPPVAPTDSGRSWDKDRGANPPAPMPPRN